MLRDARLSLLCAWVVTLSPLAGCDDRGGDRHDYLGTLSKQWDYVTTYMLDDEHGGWYDHGLDTSPESRRGRNSRFWKGNYHTVRSMAGLVDTLIAQSTR